MDITNAGIILSALSQTTRLRIYKALADELAGMSVNDLAEALGVPQNLMSTHLTVLAKAGLVTSERKWRSVVYRARRDVVADVSNWLTSSG